LLQQAYGYQVAGFGQRPAQTGGSVELAPIVLRPPDALQRSVFYHDWRIVDDTGRGKTVFQRRGVNEGLEIRARLSSGLGGAVEFAEFETHPTDDAHDGAVIRLQ
jgi:hypothetical protein